MIRFPHTEWCTLKVTLLGLVIASFGAEVDAEVKPVGNLFQATVSPVADNTECSIPGGQLFRATFIADGLEMVLNGSETQNSVMVLKNGDVYLGGGGICYQSIRRQTEVTRFEVPCPESAAPTSFAAWAQRQRITADLTAYADICLSASHVGVTSSEWKLTFTSKDGARTVSGDFATDEDALQLRLLSHPTFLNNSLLRGKSGMSAAMRLTCVDTGLEFDEGQTAKATLKAEFRLYDETESGCGAGQNACFAEVPNDERNRMVEHDIRRVSRRSECLVDARVAQ